MTKLQHGEPFPADEASYYGSVAPARDLQGIQDAADRSLPEHLIRSKDDAPILLYITMR